MWIEHFDKQSGKPFFYHSVSRETAWEAPAGAKVQYMSEAERGGGGSSSGGGTAKAGSSNAGLVTLALVLPIALPMIGLLVCYCEPIHTTPPRTFSVAFCWLPLLPTNLPHVPGSFSALTHLLCATLLLPLLCLTCVRRHGEQGGPGGRVEGAQAEARQVAKAPQHQSRKQLSAASEAVTGWQGWSLRQLVDIRSRPNTARPLVTRMRSAVHGSHGAVGLAPYSLPRARRTYSEYTSCNRRGFRYSSTYIMKTSEYMGDGCCAQDRFSQ